MKLKFKEETFKRYSDLDLEYGLTILKAELSDFENEMEILIKYGHSAHMIWQFQNQTGGPIREKIKIVEDELVTRILVSN